MAEDTILKNLDIVPQIKASAPLEDDDKLFLTQFDKYETCPYGIIAVESNPNLGQRLYVGTNITFKTGYRIEIKYSAPDNSRFQFIVYDEDNYRVYSEDVGASTIALENYIIFYQYPSEWAKFPTNHLMFGLPTTLSGGGLNYIMKDYDLPTETDVLEYYEWFVGEFGIAEKNVTEGDTSNAKGGDGTRDESSDIIEVPTVPAISMTSTGFMTTVKNPNFSNLKEMLFPSVISWDTVLYTIYGKPSDYLISLITLPFNVSSPGGVGGNLGPFINESYNIGGSKVVNQYQKIDFGSVLVDEFFASALDYAPSTEISIYLPFVGTHKLDTDEVMGKRIKIIYHVDVLSGSFVCFLEVLGLGVIYSFNGNMATMIPLTSADFSNTMGALINSSVGTGVSIATGNYAGALSGAVGAITAMKPVIEKKGNLGGSAGMMGVMTPFIIKKVPRQCLADDYAKFKGFPSNLTSKIKNLQGYTEVDSVQLKNIKATTEEKNEIISILKGGFIV